MWFSMLLVTYNLLDCQLSLPVCLIPVHNNSYRWVNDRVNLDPQRIHGLYLHTLIMVGSLRERRNSIANALGLRLSCTNPRKWSNSRGYRMDGHLIITNTTKRESCSQLLWFTLYRCSYDKYQSWINELVDNYGVVQWKYIGIYNIHLPTSLKFTNIWVLEVPNWMDVIPSLFKEKQLESRSGYCCLLRNWWKYITIKAPDVLVFFQKEWHWD